MKRTLVGLVAMTLLIGVYGCSKPSESRSESSAAPVAGEAHGEHADHDRAGEAHAMTDMEKMKMTLAKLSPEDAASAMKQHFCPVSGEMLGVMGPPIKVDVKGQQVWICCEDCRQTLLDNPEEYLSQLKN